MITSLMPNPKQQYFAIGGIPLVGGKIYTYEAGTTTPKATYTDTAGTEAQPNPIPLNARGEPAKAVFWSGNYRIDVRDALGNLVYTVDNYNTDPADAWNLKTTILDLFSKATGASLIGFLLDAANSVIRSVQDRLSDTVSVFDFMTKEQKNDVRTAAGLLDVTAAIQAAIDHAYSKNIGNAYFPAGKYAVTSIKKNWDAVKSVNIVGAGKRSTLFVKFDASTTPIFDWSANDNILETYANFASFTIIGTNKAHHGIRMTKCARFNIRDVYIGGCDRAIDNQGSLVWYGQGLSLQGNNYGLYATRSATASGGYIYPNAITLRDSQICFNTSYGIYGEYVNGMRLRDLDIEANGTAGNQSTGAIIFSQTNVETGVGSLSVDGCWFEVNYGWALTVDINSNSLTSVSVKDTQFIASEAGRAARVLSARSCLLEGVMAVTPGDTIAVAAGHSTILNSTISTITETSTRTTWLNVVTANDPVDEGGFSNGLNVSNGKPLTLSWARGAGKATLTPDTNNGHLDYVTPSGLHRFNNQIGFFAAIPAANAKAQSLFVDSADNALKFKKIDGTIVVL